jgi:hypothetical protein
LESVIAIDGALLPVRRELYRLTVLGVVPDAAGKGWHVRLRFTSPKRSRYVIVHLGPGVIERHATREDAAKLVLRATTNWLRLPPGDPAAFVEIT